MRRCWLKAQTGEALNAVLVAAGFNIKWLMRAIVPKGIKLLWLLLLRLCVQAALGLVQATHADQRSHCPMG